MTEVFILVGSNRAPEKNIFRALEQLAAKVDIHRISGFFRNPAVSKIQRPDFINGAVSFFSAENVRAVRSMLKSIERLLGRDHETDRAALQIIDLDLCLFGNLVLHDPPIILPHPDILRFPHVAVPLAELAPDFTHPVTNTPLKSIARNFLETHPDFQPVELALPAELMYLRRSAA